jgi:antitoxin VapB
MPLTIQDDETEKLANRLARRTGETVTRAVSVALEERLERLSPPARQRPRPEVVKALCETVRLLPDLDPRTLP